MSEAPTSGRSIGNRNTAVAPRRRASREPKSTESLSEICAVSMISSIGIAALLQIAETCKDRQARLILAALSDRQLGFLKMLRLDRKFTAIANLDDAIAAAAAI